MIKDYKEYFTFNHKSPIIIFWGLVTALASTAGMTLIFIDTLTIGKTLVLLCLITLFPIFLLLTVTAKVRLGNDYIERTILFRTTKIGLNEIKSFGIFSRVGSFASIIEDPNDLDRHQILEDRWIFVSRLPDFNPNLLSNTESIQIQYRPELYRLVKDMLKKPAHNKMPLQ